VLAALGTGALLGACQIDLWPLAWVALAPLSVATHGRSPAAAAGLGLLSGLVAGAALYGLSPYGGLLYALLVVYCGVHMAGFGLGIAWLSKRTSGAVRAALPAMLWTGFELLRRYGPVSFPVTLAGTHAHLPVLCQVAAITGVHGVSFVLALPAGLVLEAYASRRVPVRALLLDAVTLLGVIGGGAATLALSAERGPEVHVVGLQSALPNWVYRIAPASGPHRTLIWETLTQLNDEATARGAELVVWPETAVHEPLLARQDLRSQVRGRVERSGATLLVGTPREDRQGHRYNSVVAFVPGVRELALQDKVRPAGYAEWHITPGARHEPLPTSVGPVGVLVCLESVYPQDASALVRAGAELLVVTTDDAGFRRSPIAEFHARRSAFRAIETGRWVVHLSQAGPSYVFDPRGRRVASRGLFERGLLEARVQRLTGATPYSWLGDAWSWAIWTLLLALGVSVWRRDRRRASRNSAT